MSKPIWSKKKSDNVSAGVFLIALGVLAYLQAWWPGIIAAIGAALVVRQAFLGKIYDAFISLVVFGGIFFTIYYNLSWLPVLFVIAGLYLLFKAFLNEPSDDLEEEEEEVQKEIEEEQEDKNP
jgi:predicted membrane protein